MTEGKYSIPPRLECIYMEIKAGSKKPMFKILVTNCDGSGHLLFRDYFSLFTLKSELKGMYMDNKFIKIPEFPTLSFFQRGILFGKDLNLEKKKKAVTDFLQDLSDLSVEVWQTVSLKDFFVQTEDDRCLLECINKKRVGLPSGRTFLHPFGSTRPATTENSSDPAAETGAEGECSPEMAAYHAVYNDGGPIDSPETIKMKHNQRASMPTAKQGEDTYDSGTQEKFMAMMGYQRKSTDEVTVMEGDMVDVLQKSFSGWWFVHVETTNQEGWVPSSCLEHHQQNMSLSINMDSDQKQDICICQMMATVDMLGNEDDEVSVKNGDLVDVLCTNADGWWTVRMADGSVGVTPANYLTPLTQAKPGATETKSTKQSLYAQIDADLTLNKSFYKKEAPPRRPSSTSLYAQMNKKSKEEKIRAKSRPVSYTEVEIVTDETESPQVPAKVHDNLRSEYTDVNIVTLPPVQKSGERETSPVMLECSPTSSNEKLKAISTASSSRGRKSYPPKFREEQDEDVYSPSPHASMKSTHSSKPVGRSHSFGSEVGRGESSASSRCPGSPTGYNKSAASPDKPTLSAQRSNNYENVVVDGSKHLFQEKFYTVIKNYEPPFAKQPGLPVIPGDIVRVDKEESHFWFCVLREGERCRPIRQGWLPPKVLTPLHKDLVTIEKASLEKPPPVPPKTGSSRGLSQALPAPTQHGRPWFAGRMERPECENLLMRWGVEGDFMVRESLNRVGDFTLSVKHINRIRHFSIEGTSHKKYFIGNFKFADLNDVILHYQNHPLFYDEINKAVMLGKPFIAR